MQSPTQFTAFRCPNELLEKLKKLAEQDHRSLSNLIVITLDQAVKENYEDADSLIDHAA